MRVLVTIDHPWKESYNYAILRALLKGLAQAGSEVDLLDLNDEDFNPVMSTEELAVYRQGKVLDPRIGAYQERIYHSDHLVYIFPVWWEVMPARLKGFFDRVFLPEWAFGEEDAAPLLGHILSGTAITTMGAPKPIYTSVDAVLCKGILAFCGIQSTRWINFCEVSRVSAEQRAAWLDEIEQLGRRLGE